MSSASEIDFGDIGQDFLDAPGANSSVNPPFQGNKLMSVEEKSSE